MRQAEVFRGRKASARVCSRGTEDILRLKMVAQIAGDPVPPECEVIEVHVGELKQLFNAIDPSPFREKDLDAAVEEFIVGWAVEAPHNVPFALLVHVDRSAGQSEEPALLREAVKEFFRLRSEATRRRLRQLFRVGRTSLLIGLVFLGGFVLLGDILGRALGGQIGGVLRESLLIGGWVAMWRPLEIFLYDWWPIRAEARLFDRLSAMPVRIAYSVDANSEAWRWDWPAASPRTPSPGTVATRNDIAGGVPRTLRKPRPS
jgi:hypothetical protein